MKVINKKEMIPTLVAAVVMLVLVVGATYAYFGVNTTNNFGTKTVSASAGGVGNVVLTSPTSSIHLSISAIDMMEENEGKLYYATNETDVNRVEVTDESVNHIQSVLTNTKTLAKLTLSNDTTDTDYKCTFNLNMSVTGDMQNVIQTDMTGWDGEFYLYNQNEFNEGLGSYMSTGDLSVLMPSVLFGGSPISGTYPVTVYLNGSSNPEVSIGVSMFVENSDYDQSHLAGTTFNDTITASDLECNAVDLTEEKTSAPGTMLEGKKNVSSELLGGLYRYVGSANNNYICFGTSDVSTCTSNTDKYMYRILGVTSDNKLKLIKDSGLEDAMQWNEDYRSNVTWPNSDLYKEINGSSFLNNTTYVPDSTWANKIASTTWKYGDLRGEGFNGDIMYSLENAWNTTTNAKIGLMYMHDYAYGMNWLGAYAVGNSTWEWTMSRFGLSSGGGRYYAWDVGSGGSIGWSYVFIHYAVRPVFYLTSGITLSGEGTSSNPYLIN